MKFFYCDCWMIFRIVTKRCEEYWNKVNWKVVSAPWQGSLWLFDSRLNDLDERALQLIRQNGYFTLVSMHELRQPIEHPFLFKSILQAPSYPEPPSSTFGSYQYSRAPSSNSFKYSLLCLYSYNIFNLRHFNSCINFLD